MSALVAISKNYVVVSAAIEDANHANDFVREVSKLIDEGWLPIGGVEVSTDSPDDPRDFWYQALYKTPPLYPYQP